MIALKTPKLSLRIFFSLCLIISILSCDEKEGGDMLVMDNGQLRLGFSGDKGELLVFRDMKSNHDFLLENRTMALPWEVDFHERNDSFKVNRLTPMDFDYSKQGPLQLVLKWGNFEELANKDFQITAVVTLDKNKPLSYWKIEINGTKGKDINRVVFPIINGLRPMQDEKLAVPQWMGQLLDNPRKYLAESQTETKKIEFEYPGPLSLQCIALYSPSNTGLYLAANDTLSYRKSFALKLDESDDLTYQMTNYPSFDSKTSVYSPSYDAIIGSLQGDWITAAEQYREWGTQQKWASESRFKNSLNPTWLKETALWVWNRGRSENVLLPAADLKQRLGLPVNVFWHWWHGCSYDEGFPEYFPPREGKEPFIRAMKTAQDKGIHSIVYMNSFQWGNATKSWKTENASTYAVKDVNGQLRSHAYNIFTGNSLTNMCMATQFWRDKYTALSELAVNTYGTNGVYMDQACLNKVCYDSNHGHSLGGGNYWMKNFGKLTEGIRQSIPQGNQPLLAGEGGGESWMPYLDAFLTLQVSRERYAGVGEWETIPFFQAVYHQYAITYGNYSSLVTPPYDELWPREFAPKNHEQPLDTQYNKQFLMEQARSYVWGMQPTIANYHGFLASKRKEEIDYLMNLADIRYKGLKYLLHGKFLRPPSMEIPEEELHISKLSIYAGRKGESVTAFTNNYPMVYSGAWGADDGSVGIALTSISDHNVPIDFKMVAKDYNLPSGGKIYVVNNEGRKLLKSYKEEIRVQYKLKPREVCFFEIIPEP